MLNGIHLVDFGNHRNTRLTFGPMTALVGQNGSGKTTVMRAVGQVHGICQEPGKDIEIEDAFHRLGGDEPLLVAAWTGRLGANKGLWGLIAEGYGERTWLWRIPSQTDQEWLPDWEADTTSYPKLRLDRPGFPKPPILSITDPGTVFRLENPPSAKRVNNWKCRYFKTSASSLQRPAIADPKETTLNSDGSNLAWALSSLMTEHPDRFQRVVEALREVVPIVKSIRSKAVSLKQTVKQTITINKRDRTFDEEREVNGQELIFDMKSGKGLPATSVSEGTLVVLAVLTLLHGSDADLIMLDDVELGLHPKAQRDLIRQLCRIQETHPKLQILVSTHSPYVVDEFKAEDVWVFAPDKEGCAVTKRLSEHPDAKRALEVLTTGEFWSAEGEPWVLDEEPTARVAEEPGA
jgi:predicted ATPase